MLVNMTTYCRVGNCLRSSNHSRQRFLLFCTTHVKVIISTSIATRWLWIKSRTGRTVDHRLCLLIGIVLSVQTSRLDIKTAIKIAGLYSSAVRVDCRKAIGRVFGSIACSHDLSRLAFVGVYKTPARQRSRQSVYVWLLDNILSVAW